VQVFIHGEAQTVMHNLRPHPQGTRRRRQVGRVHLRILAARRTEETFRQWKRELAEAEASA